MRRPCRWTWCSWGPVRRGWRGRSSWRAWRRRARRRGRGPGEIEVAVLEKAEGLGEHSLSGAVVNPRAFRELFPGTADSEFPFRRPVEREAVYFLREGGAVRIPTPPTMRNHGNYVASICEIVRWLGERAEEAGVNILPGFPVDSLLVDGDDVVGVRTTPSGMDRDGREGQRVHAGDGPHGPGRGAVGRHPGRAVAGVHGVAGDRVAQPPDLLLGRQGAVGGEEAPRQSRPHDGMARCSRTASAARSHIPWATTWWRWGLVASLDYENVRLDVHGLLQRLKHHPLFREILDGGELVEWGAKTIPEGGFHSLPVRRHGAGLCIVGDAAGYVDVAHVEGRPLRDALRRAGGARDLPGAVQRRRLGGSAGAVLGGRGPVVHRGGFATQPQYATCLQERLRRGRREGRTGDAYARTGCRRGGFQRRPTRRSPSGWESRSTDRDRWRCPRWTPCSRAGTGPATTSRPTWRLARTCLPRWPRCTFTSARRACTSATGDRLVVNAPNCIDCKATDVLGPRWAPRESGSGPRYRRM